MRFSNPNVMLSNVMLTPRTASMRAVLPPSSSFCQFKLAPNAIASDMTGRFRARAALYSNMSGCNFEMSSSDVIELTSGSFSESLPDSRSDSSRFMSKNRTKPHLKYTSNVYTMKKILTKLYKFFS